MLLGSNINVTLLFE